MSTVAMVAAALAGLGHVAVFVMESVLFHQPRVQRIMTGRTGASRDVRLWAFNQGFYNLFLALGALAGIVIWLADEDIVGRTLIAFSCGAMALAGLVLFVSERRLWRGALGQSVPSAVAVIATLMA